MKISYSNYPILEKLQNEKLGKLPFCKEDELFLLSGEAYNFGQEFQKKAKKFKKDIYVISEAFANAADKSKEKLKHLYSDILKDKTINLDFSCSFVYDNKVFMINHNILRKNDTIQLDLFVFTKYGTPLMMCYQNSEEDYFFWGTNGITPNLSIEEKNAEINRILIDMVILYMFRTYAEIETKILEPSTRKKEISSKYVNDTKLKLTFMDSKWFTNLVKSDAFKVRGHFRMQPYKDTKKLIWINEFEKSGYTAKARKLVSDCS